MTGGRIRIENQRRQDSSSFALPETGAAVPTRREPRGRPWGDRLNLAILNLLQRDALMSHREIAASLGKPETTIRDRIKSMERRGVIKGYVADIDRTKLGYHCNAYVMAEVNPAKLDLVTSRLLSSSHVSHIYHLSGPRRLAFLVVARDLDHLAMVVQSIVADLGLTNEEVLVVLRTVSDCNILPFE